MQSARSHCYQLKAIYTLDEPVEAMEQVLLLTGCANHEANLKNGLIYLQ